MAIACCHFPINFVVVVVSFFRQSNQKKKLTERIKERKKIRRLIKNKAIKSNQNRMKE